MKWPFYPLFSILFKKEDDMMEFENNLLNTWNTILYKLLFTPRISLISNKKIKHTIILLENYYHEQTKKIQGKDLSNKTRHLKNLKRTLPDRKILIFLALFFKLDINETNKLLNDAFQQELQNHCIIDRIYMFMIEENRKEEYANCIFFLYDVLYDFGISHMSVTDFLSNHSYPSYNYDYLTYNIHKFDKYIYDNNLENKFLSKDEIIKTLSLIINEFVFQNYSNLFSNKKSLTLRNILRCNLSTENTNEIIQTNINRHIISITDFRNITIEKIREKFILIGFYIGMDIEEINTMMNQVYLNGLNNTNSKDIPIINIISSIKTINPTLLPYKITFIDYRTDKEIRDLIINAESLGDILTEYSKYFYEYSILGNINHIFYTK